LRNEAQSRFALFEKRGDSQERRPRRQAVLVLTKEWESAVRGEQFAFMLRGQKLCASRTSATRSCSENKQPPQANVASQPPRK